jgi:hypothetical protein
MAFKIVNRELEELDTYISSFQIQNPSLNSETLIALGNFNNEMARAIVLTSCEETVKI